MEVILYLALFYGGIMLIGWLFEQIGKWNDERKSKIRDRVAQELLPLTDITNELIDNYKTKLQAIGYSSNQDNWLYKYIQTGGRKRYTMLIEKCPSCNEGDLRVVTGKYGKFLGCSSFPKCKYTKNLDVAMSEYKEKANKDFLELFNLAYQA